ncbi:MAG: hypothetical protein FJ102_17795 [Deltaproteobacteria bacterium]|nr:hypothetical protein [Deltaproteobacteria bacterium]
MTPALEAGGWKLEIEAAAGARAAIYVGDEADTLALDPVATEGVTVFPAALGAQATRGPWFAELRVEEGTVHAGGLELGEARVGADLGDLIDLWVGRDDVLFTIDRAEEPEQLSIGVRPALSRAWLPAHATGLGASLGAAGRASLDLAAQYASSTADAPHLLARGRVVPLARGAASLAVGGGVAYLPSPSLGTQLGYTLDVDARHGEQRLCVGYTAIEREGLSSLGGVVIGLDARFLPARALSPGVALRGERVTGLDPAEDARWLASTRLGLRFLDRKGEAYVEALHATEEGEVATGAGVVVLDDRVERANDVIQLGLAFRL